MRDIFWLSDVLYSRNAVRSVSVMRVVPLPNKMYRVEKKKVRHRSQRGEVWYEYNTWLYDPSIPLFADYDEARRYAEVLFRLNQGDTQ